MIYLLCLFVVGIMFYAVSCAEVMFKWLFQLVAMTCLVLFILSVTRYFIYEYKYIVTENSFVVVRKNGKRETSLCNLNLSTGIGIYTLKEFKTEKKNIGHIKALYNYTQNFMSDKKIYYIFEFNDDKFGVAFEADENFVSAVKERIAQ